MNVEAENGVIGAILVNNEVLEEIYGFLHPEMFSHELNKACYEKALEYWNQGRAIDQVILSAQLENIGLSNEVISEHLIRCVLNAPQDRYGAKEYAKVILSDYKTNCLRKVTQGFSLVPNNIDNEINRLSDAIENINSKTMVTKARTMAEIISGAKERYFHKKVLNGVKTGFYKLDEILYCLEAGDVTVVGARPSVGKSAFVTQVIMQIAQTGKRVGYFNLEMMDTQVYERMLAFVSKIDMNRIKRAETFEDSMEQTRFERANEILSRYPISVTQGSTTVSQIRKESKHSHYDVIVIDYLQLIKADRQYPNRASEVGDISKSIKALAMELQIPIILLSQLNRTSEVKETKEPTMAELRESGDIEQDASNILLLWNLSSRDDRYKGLKVEKNRQGERGVCIGMEFKGSQMRFEERLEDFDRFKNIVKNMEKSIDDLNNFCATDEEADEIFD